MYFQDSFGPEFSVKPRSEFKNAPLMVKPKNLTKFPEPGKPFQGEEMKQFIHEMTTEIARILNLERK
jgi:threonine synthase